MLIGAASVTAVLLVVVVGHVSVYKVAGRSMEQTYAAGDVLLIESLTFRFRSPRRFEVVVIRDPAEPGRLDVKRIVGLPGETVEASNQRMLIDGREVTTPPGLMVPQWFGPQAAGDGYFLLGDNTAESRDSRTFGSVMPGGIVGRVAATLSRKRGSDE